MHDSILDPTSGPEIATEVLVAPRVPLGQRRITVVDDSPEFLELMRDVLGTRYEVTTHSVVHDVSALTAPPPDLLVIDLHCGGPEGGLDGWEILAQARRDPDLRDIPALVCSGDLAALREDRIRLVAYGDVQLIAKPFDVRAFEQTVDRMIRLSGTRVRTSPDDAEYPPLEDRAGRFREGRPLRMCPHGKVLEQGDFCRLCG